MNRRKVLRALAGAAGLAMAGANAACGRAHGHGRLVVAMNQVPTTLDYALSGGAANAMRPFNANIFEGLVDRAPNGDIVPGLATWEISPDARVIRFNLRRDVRFHDGARLTSRDVEFSHLRLQQHLPLYRSRTRTLERVERIDDHTIDFHFSDSGLSFVRNAVLQVYSSRYYDEVGEARFVAEPVGTGPYRLIRYRQSEYADLDAFDEYWAGKPPVPRVRVVFVQEDMTRIAMLRSGEADLVMATPFSMVHTLRDAGYHSVQTDVSPTFSVRFQLANPSTPWADVRVRRAIAHAIDAPSIINGLFDGIPKRYAGFAPGELGFDPSLEPHAYDPARARALLAEAGHPGGFRMPLVYWTNTYYGIRETTEAVALYLKAVGIECEVAGIDTSQGLAMNRSVARDPQARLVTIAPALLASFADPIEAMRMGYSSGSAYSWYRNERFDALVRKAMQSPDAAVQDAALRQCARMLHEDLPIVPLWNNVVVYTMRPGLRYQPIARDIPSMALKNVRLV